MTTGELTCVAVLRSNPDGEVELVAGDASESAFGPVEIAWFPDRVRITALGAGPGSVLDTYLAGEAAQDIVVEIRLPELDELAERLPGAD